MERRNESWTFEERSKLKKFLDLGLTVEEISRALQRTVLGVLYKMWCENMPAQLIFMPDKSFVRKLCNCKSEYITGICKELYGSFESDKQEIVIRCLLTLDLCRAKWIKKKREERKHVWFIDIETVAGYGLAATDTIPTMIACFDYAAAEKAILLEQIKQQRNRKNMRVIKKFDEFVSNLSLELQVPPRWIETRVNEILNK